MSCTEVLNPEGVPLSAYWKMTSSAREARKEYARQRYRMPDVRNHTKRHQYMKCLRAGLIAHPKPSTLARNGIFRGPDWEYSFIQDA